jgi:hypothetical protein
MHKLWEWFKKDKTIKECWNSRKVGVLLWIIFGALIVYWHFCVPPPGDAIGILALVAGIMSVRDIKTLGKILWVVLLVCLLVTEFRAIDKDRADNEQKQKEFFEAQKTGFQGIATQADSNFKETANGLEAAITVSQTQFDTTMKRSDKLLNDLQENLRTLTGSESFAWLGFLPGQNFLAFVHQGRYPLYGVSARIVDLDQIKKPEDSFGQMISIGDMVPKHANAMPLPLGYLPTTGDRFNANVFFTARNGDWVQMLREIKVKDRWVRAFQVQGPFTSPVKKKIMCETIDPDFPRRADGKIDGFLVHSGIRPPRCQ